MSLIGTAVGNVFFSKAVEVNRQGNLAILVSRVHNYLAEIAMPPTLILALFGSDLFFLVFGAEWREAGVFVQLMTPMLYFQFILSPISSLFNVLEKQKQGMFLQLLMLILRLASIIIGKYLNSINLSIILFSLGSAISYYAFLIWLMLISGNKWTATLKPTIQALYFGLLIVSPLFITNLFTSNLFLLLISLFVTISLTGWRYSVILNHKYAL